MKASPINPGKNNATKTVLKREVKAIEKQIEQLVDRIVETDNATAAPTYERKISKLEKNKHIALDKLQNGSAPVRSFNEMFELAFTFLSNPWNLWNSERIEDKRTVLKLAFPDRLSYNRKTGLRTPNLSILFKYLEGENMRGEGMKRLEGKSSNSAGAQSATGANAPRHRRR